MELLLALLLLWGVNFSYDGNRVTIHEMPKEHFQELQYSSGYGHYIDSGGHDLYENQSPAVEITFLDDERVPAVEITFLEE